MPKLLLSYFQIWRRYLIPWPTIASGRFSVRQFWPWTLTLTSEKLIVKFSSDAEQLCQIRENRNLILREITTSATNERTNQQIHVEVTRGVATGGYIGIYTPQKISPSKFLWCKNDVRTAIQQFYTPSKTFIPQNKFLATPLEVGLTSDCIK